MSSSHREALASASFRCEQRDNGAVEGKFPSLHCSHDLTVAQSISAVDTVKLANGASPHLPRGLCTVFTAIPAPSS
jgi:hypothetical protein